MSGGRGSSSGNPADQPEGAESNQSSSSSSSSSSRGRRTADRQQGDRQPASEEDVDLAEVLAYLLRRGQVRLVHGSGATGLQLVQSYSDSDEDSDGAWEGRLGNRYNPPGNLPWKSSRCRGSSFSHGECSRIPTHYLITIFFFLLLLAADQNVRLYDTTRGRFHLRRTVKARDVGWSVLDVCFTPDAQNVLYSSWSDYIHMCSIDGDSENHTALDLNPDERRFCVFSLAASTDGNEILGGANDGCLYVFDLEQNKRTLKIDAHEDDVNAVAFADSSSQLLFSGSDDAVCKVWDRRTLREDRPQPVGQLAGHRDGITFIHSKGDARYLISNSKDQSIKLWDVRKFSPKEGLAASRLAVTQQNWDYRWQQVPQRALKRHKLTGDTSVMTYRGHGVLHTLVRCRFSPEFSTGQRFIYSGCSTGKIIIYDVLTGSVVSRLSGHDACVRDVSWHPYEDNIVSSSWDGAVRMWEHRQTHPLEEEREREKV
uniref:Ddb1 and cul4 associated factor 11 n=1 Tax=Sander lucioperca TaxID=283035 RepID=A0A8D0A6F9_SANLU